MTRALDDLAKRVEGDPFFLAPPSCAFTRSARASTTPRSVVPWVAGRRT